MQRLALLVVLVVVGVAGTIGAASAQQPQPETITCPVVPGYQVVFNLEEEVRFDTFSGGYTVNCWYNAAPAANGDPGEESELIVEVFWAPPDGDENVLEWKPEGVGGITVTYCSDVDEFANGFGVTPSGEHSVRSIYQFRAASKPYDQNVGRAAAEGLRAAVSTYARSCEGVEIIPRASYYTPLPPYLAEARAAAGDIPEPTAAEPPPTTVAPVESSGETAEDVAVSETSAQVTETSSGSTTMRILGWVLLVVSVLGLLWTISRSGKERRVRPRFDIARIVLIGGMAIGMFVVLGNTPTWAAVVGTLLGLVLGWTQGRNVTLRIDGKKAFEKRTALAVGAFIVGLVVAQVAGLLNRTGAVKIGVGLSFLSVAAAIGLFAGRRKQLDEARSNATAAATIVGMIFLALIPIAAAAVAQEAVQDARTAAILQELSDSMDWDTIEVGGGLFARELKPPAKIAIAPGLTEVPEPVSRSISWSYLPPIWDNDAGIWLEGDPANQRSFDVTETFTFGLTVDGICCTATYDGAGTQQRSVASTPASITATGTLGDYTAVADRVYSTFDEAGRQAWGLPFDEPQYTVVPNDDRICQRPIVEKGRGEITDWTTTRDGEDGEGFPGPEFNMYTECDVDGFNVESALDELPPVPARSDPVRAVTHGTTDAAGCPVFSESYTALYDPSMGAAPTNDVRRLMLNPNTSACSAWVTVGPEGPGGVRSEMQYDLSTPDPYIEPNRQFEATDSFFSATPLHEIAEERRCEVGSDGIALAPAESGGECVSRGFHEVGGGVITIWTDYESTDGPNVIVRGMFPWGNYRYRCHHCDASSPEIPRIVAAMEVLGATGFGNFGPDAEVIGSVGAPEGKTGETTGVDTTVDPALIEALTDDPHEAALLAGLIAVAGTIGLAGVSIAENALDSREDDEPGEADGDGGDDEVSVWDPDNRVAIWMSADEAEDWYERQKQKEIERADATGKADIETSRDERVVRSALEEAEAADRMRERAENEAKWAEWEERMKGRDVMERRQDLLEADSMRKSTSSDWWWSAYDEFQTGIKEDINEVPGDLYDAFGAGVRWTGEQLADGENWTIAWETARDSVKDAILVVLGDPATKKKVADNFVAGIQKAGDIAGTLYAAAEQDWSAVPGKILSTILGAENWEKALDKDTPLTERVARVLWGVVDTGGVLFGAGATAVKVADKIGDLARGAGALGDASKVARGAGVLGDGSKVVRGADKASETARLGDATVGAKRVADAEELAKLRAAAKTRKEAQAGLSSFDEMVVDGKLPRDAWVRNLPEGAVIERNWLHEIGYSDDQIKALAKVAKEHKITIGSRTTNMDSMHWIRDGKAVAKPLDIKAKTISQLDTYLGASKADQGLVGYFRPTKPNMDIVPDHLKELVEIRYQARLDEFNDLRQDVTRLVTRGEYVEQNGKLLKILPDGKRMPVAGDIDLVYLRKANGDPLSASEYIKARDALKASGAQIQHGAETDVINFLTKGKTPGTPEWDEAYNKAVALHAKLEEGHASGKEIITQMGPDGILRRGERISTLPQANRT